MIALAALAALAAEPVTFTPDIDLRLIGTLPDSFPLAEDGSELLWGPALDSRLRSGLLLEGEKGRGELQIDLLTGQFAGATWDLDARDERRRDARLAATAEGVVLRRLSVGIREAIFDLEAGLQTSQWGLGMLANDGSADPLFGRTDFGDRVLRARAATMPLGREVPLFLVLAGDLVISDEFARLSEGDRALQGIGALMYRREGTEAGLYGVLRRQGERIGELQHTRLSVVDLYLRHEAPLGSARLDLGLEAAAIAGRTEIASSYLAPDSQRIRSGGFSARAVISGDRLALHQRALFASGDPDPDDGIITDFRFDRDHDVGFVLFDEVISAVDLKTIDLVSDPSVSAVPPEGVQSLAAEGAFHQAFALQEAAELRLGGLVARVGGVFAWSTAPIAHPYYTFRNGGVPLNYAGNTPEGRYLGSELDWAIGSSGPSRAREGEPARLYPTLLLQVGHAWPSLSYSGIVDRVDHVMLVLRARYGR